MLRLLLAALALCMSCAVAAAHEQVVTVVAGAASADGKPLRLLDRVAAPALLRLAADARLVLFCFDDARETTLAGPGSFRLGAGGVDRAGAGGTLQVRRMDPAFRRMAGQGRVQAGVSVRAGSGGTAADAPRNGETVLPGAPRFRWSERARVGAYRFVLGDDAGQVLHEAAPAGPGYAPAIALAPATVYRWELSWRDPAGQARLALQRFSTLAQDAAADAERLRPGPDAPAQERIVYGLWLRSLGATTLAEPYLQP